MHNECKLLPPPRIAPTLLHLAKINVKKKKNYNKKTLIKERQMYHLKNKATFFTDRSQGEKSIS
jgi:hypothetical protein